VTRPFEVITFDCYGTLIDWEGGITHAFQTAARADGLVLGREAIVTAYHEVEPTVQSQEYRTYRAVLGETAVVLAKRLGWKLPSEGSRFLADSIADWEPFPDTNAALRQLAADGYALGILSNVDDEILEETLRHLAVEFRYVVTAEHVRSYKPAEAHFHRAGQLLGTKKWLHVAQSYFHDVEPATALGLPVVWLNRKQEPPSGEARPTAEVATLTDLVAWLRST
jgi:2-haloalkanoic acid dehalogenase type II